MTSDEEGRVYKTLLTKHLFGFIEAESNIIVEKSSYSFSEIEIPRLPIMDSDDLKAIHIACLICDQKICVIQIEPKIAILYLLNSQDFFVKSKKEFISKIKLKIYLFF